MSLGDVFRFLDVVKVFCLRDFCQKPMKKKKTVLKPKRTIGQKKIVNFFCLFCLVKGKYIFTLCRITNTQCVSKPGVSQLSNSCAKYQNGCKTKYLVKTLDIVIDEKIPDRRKVWDLGPGTHQFLFRHSDFF